MDVTNQGSKVAQPPHGEICDKQRLIDEGLSGARYGVRSQKAPQDSQLHQNTSAGLSQVHSGHTRSFYWQRKLWKQLASGG